MDSPLSRVYYEVFLELNFGYRELWTAQEHCKMLENHGYEVVALKKTHGYGFDMMGAACRAK